MREVRLSAFAGTAIAGIALTGAALLTTGSATLAADLPAPPPVYEPAPPPVAIGGGWYLRGDVGVTQQHLKDLTNVDLDARVINAGDSIDFIKQSFNPAATIGVGVGYQVNNWFRADVTGEYRTRSRYSATEQILRPDGTTAANGVNYFDAAKTEWVGLANAYLDLGTWGGLTPYVGAGIGFARVRISHFRDINLTPGNPTVATAPAGARTNFAWALHTGFAYQFSDTMKMDVGYRYLNMGKGQTGGPARDQNGGGTSQTPWVFNNLHSHDIRVGLRWMLAAPQSTTAYWDEPVIRKH